MIVVRACSGFDELEACVRLQIETWGYDPSDVVPRKTFLVAQKIGGQVLGAFDTAMAKTASEGGFDSLVGFLFALPGIQSGKASPAQNCAGAPAGYLHSHMLAVRQSHRNCGVGTQLKLAQRRDALGRGIRHIEWTFDPLEIKNAYLNIHKLGAIVRCYHKDFYGVSSSRLQGGLPTDRMVAEWDLDSARVKAALEGKPAVAHTIEERILVPASIYAWKAANTERERAAAVQLENRLKFQQAFSQGLAVLGFVRDAEGNGVFELGPLPKRSWSDFPRNDTTL